MSVVRLLAAILHLVLAGGYMGSMAYSLAVMQPKVDRFLPDERRREAFFVALAHGNRWRVAALLIALALTGAIVIASSGGRMRIGFAVSLALYAVAATIFINVSWRHWPARVFAETKELAGFRRRLRLQATAILALVATAFIVALTVSLTQS